MKTVILEVASLDDSRAAFSHAWKTGKVEPSGLEHPATASRILTTVEPG